MPQLCVWLSLLSLSLLKCTWPVQYLFSAQLPSAAEACERGLEKEFPWAHAASSWCLFAVCSPRVQAVSPGRRRQKGRNQLLEPRPPPVGSVLLKRLGERCRYLLCLVAMTVLFGTLQKPLCVERSQAGPLGCVHFHICYLLHLFLKRQKVPHSFPASYCLLCCHEPLHFDQGLWKRKEAFLGH